MISVINDFHLKNGDFFPLPIFLDIDEDTKQKIKNKKKVDLIFKDKKVGTIYIDDIYKPIKLLQHIKIQKIMLNYIIER